MLLLCYYIKMNDERWKDNLMKYWKNGYIHKVKYNLTRSNIIIIIIQFWEQTYQWDIYDYSYLTYAFWYIM